MVRLARKTKHENGILGIPMLILRYRSAIETIKKVINFYDSDEIKRLFIRKKENK